MPSGATTASWTPQRRQAMSEWMYKHRPWDRATGPKTPEGKRASAMRWAKSGTRSAAVKQAASVKAALSRIEKELLADG
jgi:hypothetical protein